MAFLDRVGDLPRLGVGISTESGVALDGTAPLAFRSRLDPGPAFLEIGVTVETGADLATLDWVDAGLPCTYHFLDLNVDEPEDFDDAWVAGLLAHVGRLRPAWICGDAGTWHVGARTPGQMLLLPPILVRDAVAPMAEGLARLRALTRLEVFPENPPGRVFFGDLHLLDFFASVIDQADTGMLLDCAHLAIFQRSRGLPATAGLDGFPLDRIVEMHVAGGRPHRVLDAQWIEDDHGVDVLPDTWAILEAIVPRAPNLRAIVVECERNPPRRVQRLFDRVGRVWR